MLNAIESVPKIVKAVNHPALGQRNVSPAAARSSYSAPDVILSLGRGLPTTPTYNSAGLLNASLQRTSSAALTTLSSGNINAQAIAANDAESAPTLTSIPPSQVSATTTADSIAAAVDSIGTAAIASAVDAVAPLEPPIAAAPATAPAPPVPSPTAAPAPSNTATTGTTGIPVLTAQSATSLAQNASATAATVTEKFSVNLASQALSNITVNPAYAAIASSLYLSVAAYRVPQTAVQTLLDRTDTPRAVNGISAAKKVGAEPEQGEAGNAQSRGSNRARDLRA